MMPQKTRYCGSNDNDSEQKDLTGDLTGKDDFDDKRDDDESSGGASP
jgi:hypothetical protein